MYCVSMARVLKSYAVLLQLSTVCSYSLVHKFLHYVYTSQVNVFVKPGS